MTPDQQSVVPTEPPAHLLVVCFCERVVGDPNTAVSLLNCVTSIVLQEAPTHTNPAIFGLTFCAWLARGSSEYTSIALRRVSLGRRDERGPFPVRFVGATSLVTIPITVDIANADRIVFEVVIGGQLATRIPVDVQVNAAEPPAASSNDALATAQTRPRNRLDPSNN